MGLPQTSFKKMQKKGNQNAESHLIGHELDLVYHYLLSKISCNALTTS